MRAAVQADSRWNGARDRCAVRRPEYETLAALGSYLGVSDVPAICKAHEICNRYGMDTISAGGTLAWAAEAVETGLLDLGSLDLRFGSAEGMLAALEAVARREGLGDLLAEGSFRAARRVGGGAEGLTLCARGMELPAHSPLVKKGLAITYAVHPCGPDHNASDHDPNVATESLSPGLRSLGVLGPIALDELTPEKVRFIVYTQIYCSLLDSLRACLFCFGPGWLLPPGRLVDVVNAATGWETSLWELMKVGERRLNMLRVLNAREGIDGSADRLPERLYTLAWGGKRLERKAVDEAVQVYYRMMGWEAGGLPGEAKLAELGLQGWA